MPADWTPAMVGQAALPRIVEAVHATRAVIILKGTNIAGEGVAIDPSDRSETHFPLRLALRCPSGGHHGWLLLGPRPDGSNYGKDDVEALEAVLPALRRALLASQERERVRRRDEGAWSKYRATIASIVERVRALETVRGCNS